MAKVLAIAGSPRKGGNSDTLLESFIKGAKASGHDVEKLYAASLKIAPCDEGNGCHRMGTCHIHDDMQDVYRKLLEADHLVMSSPTFFMGPPAQLKALIDRCQMLWARKYVLKEKLRKDEKERHAFILPTSGLDKKEAFIATRQIIKSLFYVLEYKFKGEVLVEGVDKKGDIERRKDALNEAYELGKAI